MVSLMLYDFLRLAKPEDVQYFQFDSNGNMYVFEPGAGCSGLARKVEPGEEWDLTNLSNSNVSHTQTYDLIPPSNVISNVVDVKVEGPCSQPDSYVSKSKSR